MHERFLKTITSRCHEVFTATMIILFIQIMTSEVTADVGPQSGVFPDEMLDVSGTERHYRLVVPKRLSPKKSVPCVFAFHGMGIDSKELMPRYSKLDELAAARKFLLVYPEAIGKSWGIAPAKVRADLAFFDALLAKLGKRYHLDEKRIYVLGMSNGGYFAHLVGKERSQTVAAVCSHSGPLGLQTLLGIRAARKFPVMIVYGAEDSLFPVTIARDNRDAYLREDHPVKYVEVPGLNHLWATKVDINDQIWGFFESHPLSK